MYSGKVWRLYILMLGCKGLRPPRPPPKKKKNKKYSVAR